MDKTVPFSKSQCCGCSACVDVCPHHAISMQSDKEGFLYPVIDKNICTDCGLCLKNCAFYNRKAPINLEAKPTTYIVKHKNVNTRMNSRSGGVFVAVSDWILSVGGVVYGCVLTSDMQVKHIRAITPYDRDKMCKSKYVQSDTREIFPVVENDLNEGSKVLFSGTGCQVDGLLSYLKFKKCNLDNLYTIDIVCHGVPSPLIFDEYIKWAEKKYKGKITDFEFRDKTVCGWDGHLESFIINQKKYKKIIYRELFYSNSALRLSCYSCKYSCIKRSSDITIADAWGIKQANPEFNDNRGVSLVMIQSPKGQELIHIIESSCDIKEVSLDKYMQPNLSKPSVPKGDRDKFWDTYYSDGIDGLIKTYAKQTFIKRLKDKCKYILRIIKYRKRLYLP